MPEAYVSHAFEAMEQLRRLLAVLSDTSEQSDVRDMHFSGIVKLSGRSRKMAR
ncbi:hypothetical protein ABH944_008099 [Caballeronia udeis]|jgi:hypothetical protein|uniref:Uncharacterized protein n=1 Tax=Caballeronia udeis TaxID=1232866 RepID=A0ABW8MW32_9BURK